MIPIEYILSPRDSEDAAPPYWTKSGTRPNWRHIVADYGHNQIQDTIDDGDVEPWVATAYTTWTNNR